MVEGEAIEVEVSSQGNGTVSEEERMKKLEEDTEEVPGSQMWICSVLKNLAYVEGDGGVESPLELQKEF